MDSPRKSRLAQGAFILAFVAFLEFLLHLSPAAAQEWDSTREGGLELPVALCSVLTAAGVLCGFVALYRIVKSKGALKGLTFSLCSIVLSILTLVWMFSTLSALSRHRASRQAAWVQESDLA